MTRKRRKRKTVVRLAGVLIVLIVLIVLLPTILNLGVGKAIITGAINDRVQGTATIDRLRLRWFGAQTVEGLAITDAGGAEAVNVNTTLGKGLLPLLFGALDGAELAVDGTLRGDLRLDGSTSFADLLRSEEAIAGDGGADAEEAEVPRPRDEPFSLAGIPALSVQVDGLRIELTLRPDEPDEPGESDEAAQASRSAAVQTFVFNNLTGRAQYKPGGISDLHLTSATTAGDLVGSIDVEASAAGLFDANGVLTPSGATVSAGLSVDAVPILFTPDQGRIETLLLTASTDDLAERIDVSIGGEATLAGSESSELNGALTIVNPMRAGGGLNIGLDNTTGTITGRHVPSALFQPALADTHVRLSRDLGSSFDVTAEFSAGAEKETSISLAGAHATLDLAAVVASDGSIDGRRLEAKATVQRELLLELTGMAVEAPIPLEVVVNSFHLPRRTADGKIPLHGLAMQGGLSAAGPHAITLPVEPPMAVEVANIRIAVDTATLQEGIRIEGSADVDEGSVIFDEMVTSLFDEAGDLALAAATPVGRVEASALDGGRLAPLLGPSGAKPIVQGLLAGMVNASLQTARSQDDLQGDFSFHTDLVDATGSVVRRSGALHVAAGEATITVTPAVVAALQEESEEPIRLGGPAKAMITLEPFDLPGASYDEYALPDRPVEVKVALEDVQIEHPALEEPVLVRDVSAAIVARLGASPAWRANGEARLDRVIEKQRIAGLRFDLNAEGEDAMPRGTITADRLNVRQLEPVLGMSRDALAGWVGGEGAITAVLSGQTAARQVALRSDLPNLQGEMLLAMGEDAISIRADELRFNLQREAAEAMLNTSSEDEEAARITVTDDVPFTVSVQRLDAPLALIRGEPFEPGAVKIEAALDGGPLTLANADGVFSTVRELHIDARTEDLSEGIAFDLSGSTAAGAAQEPGVISIAGTVDGLLTEEKTLDAAGASLTMNATAERVPTVIADSILGLESLLVAAVGEEMSVSFRSKGFSQDAGWVDGRIDTTNGFLEGVVKGKERSLRSTQNRPIEGELEVTPPLRERLLARIHPVLADVRSVEHPVRFTVPQRLEVPLDGDVSRLKADLEIDIGAVEFDSGSMTLDLLRRFDTPEETIPGLIEPIISQIRKGVITYDRFAVHIGKYTLVYEGKVDLNTRTVDLRTELPLEALALTFEELEGYVDKIIVPLWTHGSFDDPKTEIHPDFDLLEAAAQAGFRGTLRNILKDRGLPGGEILDELLRRAEEEGGDRKKDD